MLASHRIRLQQIIREAEGYLELNMPLQALSALDRVRDSGTFGASLLRLRGNALRELERYPEAIEALSGAADLDPASPPHCFSPADMSPV